MKTFGLLGEKLGHSFSPQIHAMLGTYEYLLYEVAANELSDFMADPPDGFNVTIPYKESVIPYCSVLSSGAAAIGSVNTVVKQADGSLYGDNTDYYGFEYLLKKSGAVIEGKKALVLGNGGASKTVRAVLQDMNAAEVLVISRSGENNYNNLSLHYDADIIINTTPLGMFPNVGAQAVDLSLFNNCSFVGDVIYNPARTALLLQAEALGIKCINGLPMLVAQAKRAAEIFTGNRIPDERIEEITNMIALQTKNIALIGMPGCGKSTVGSFLATKCHRVFVDLDLEIEKRAGTSIPEIFSTHGEAYFRELETQVLADFSKQSELIISCGGGIVTMDRNLELLQQNSTVVLIERPIEDLSSDGRPVSQSRRIEDIYKERQPKYMAWSDLRVQNEIPEETANEIYHSLLV